MAKIEFKTKRQVISTSSGKRKMKDGNLAKTEMVIYRTPINKVKGVIKYRSVTKHEIT